MPRQLLVVQIRPFRQVRKMSIKSVGSAVFIVGILIVLASLLADSIGIGGSPGFGPGQNMGLIIGPIICFVGFRLRGKSD